MDIRTNTILGWILAALFVALGLGNLSHLYFKSEKLEKPGFPIEGAVEASEAGPAAPEVPIEVMMASADVTQGAEVFKKCASCHTVTQGGANGIGPNLWATVGEAIAVGKGGYAFSDALKGKGGKWDFATLNEWITNPRKFASGTKMSFAGLADPAARANVIAYLNAQGSNIPLPPVPAAAAANTLTTPEDPPLDGNAAAPADAAAPAEAE